VIYLCERAWQYVGPFKNREDADRFIGGDGVGGEDWTGTKKVVVEVRLIRRYCRQMAFDDRESATHLFSQVIRMHARAGDAREGP